MNAALAGDTCCETAATYEMPSATGADSPARSRSTISVVTSFVKPEAAKSTASAAITATIRRRRPKQSESAPGLRAPGVAGSDALSPRKRRLKLYSLPLGDVASSESDASSSAKKGQVK